MIGLSWPLNIAAKLHCREMWCLLCRAGKGRHLDWWDLRYFKAVQNVQGWVGARDLSGTILRPDNNIVEEHDPNHVYDVLLWFVIAFIRLE